MNIKHGTKSIVLQGQQLNSIIEFEFNNYVLYVFAGKLSPNDILIKYKKERSKIRTPKHIHWVVDVLLKMENNKELTIQFLNVLKHIWTSSQPLPNRQFDTIKSKIQSNLTNIEQFSDLNSFGEYPVDFLFVLMQLLSIQEKTNREDAFMFGKIIDELLESNLDIFKVVSRAGFGGRH